MDEPMNLDRFLREVTELSGEVNSLIPLRDRRVLMNHRTYRRLSDEAAMIRFRDTPEFPYIEIDHALPDDVIAVAAG